MKALRGVALQLSSPSSRGEKDAAAYNVTTSRESVSEPFESLGDSRSCACFRDGGPAVNLRSALNTACRVIPKARAMSVYEEICSGIERFIHAGACAGAGCSSYPSPRRSRPCALIGGSSRSRRGTRKAAVAVPFADLQQPPVPAPALAAAFAVRYRLGQLHGMVLRFRSLRRSIAICIRFRWIG